MAHRKLLPDNKGLYNLSKYYFVKRPHPLNDGIAKDLPAAYKRYYEELLQKPTAVHHIPPKQKYQRDPVTGQVKRFQDDPPQILYPQAFHKGLWGGAGIIKGFNQTNVKIYRAPKFWAPTFETSVVYSEVLDIFITTVTTKRTIQLIHKYHGFDHYLLQTSASDLRSDLALKIKRNILLALDKKELPHTDVAKRDEVYDTYKHYLEKYDSEFIQWYGLKIGEALEKYHYNLEKERGNPQPFKHLYRKEFLEELRTQDAMKEEPLPESSTISSIISKFNPFKRNSS